MTTIEKVRREVIENCLLTALQQGEQVAILATKQDLDDIIAALRGYAIGDFNGEVLSWRAYEARRQQMAMDMEKLRQAAFVAHTSEK